MAQDNAKPKKKLKVILIIVVSAIVVGGIVGALWWFSRQQPGDDVVGQESEQNEGYNTPFMDVTTNADTLIAEGNLEGARQAFDAQLQQLSTDKDRADLLLAKAISFGDAGHYDLAIEAALQAVNYYGSSQQDLLVVYQNLANYYEKAGQYASAIEYLEKILALLDAGVTLEGEERDTYEIKVRELQAS